MSMTTMTVFGSVASLGPGGKCRAGTSVSEEGSAGPSRARRGLGDGPRRSSQRDESGRVGPVYQVLGRDQPEVASDGSLRRLLRVGRTHHLSNDRDRVVTFDGHRDDRTRCDEFKQLAEERLLRVLGVMLGGKV